MQSQSLIMEPAISEQTTQERFSVEAGPDECVIHHVRDGTRDLNHAIWVTFISLAAISGFLVWMIAAAAPNERFPAFDLCRLLAPVAVLLACWLAYSYWSRKTFRLTANRLEIDTQLFGISQRWVIPRESISLVRQVSGRIYDYETVPTWNLQLVLIRGADSEPDKESSWIYRLPQFRPRSILWRLPYEDTEWLGGIIAKWANADLELQST